MADKIEMVEQTRQDTESFLGTKFDVPGKVFRWVNAEARRQRDNFKYWRVVERDSELGEIIAQQIADAPDRYMGPNEDSNYFRRGEQLILAYADEEVHRKHGESLTKRADDRLRQVINTPGADLRQVIISSPTSKK